MRNLRRVIYSKFEQNRSKLTREKSKKPSMSSVLANTYIPAGLLYRATFILYLPVARSPFRWRSTTSAPPLGRHSRYSLVVLAQLCPELPKASRDQHDFFVTTFFYYTFLYFILLYFRCNLSFSFLFLFTFHYLCIIIYCLNIIYYFIVCFFLSLLTIYILLIFFTLKFNHKFVSCCYKLSTCKSPTHKQVFELFKPNFVHNICY